MHLKKLNHFVQKHFKLSVFLTVLLLLFGLLVLTATYFVNKYWNPPLMLLTPHDLGKTALLRTNLGDIEIQLSSRSPLATAQFSQRSRSGFYDNIRFHRIVPNLLIETGDPLTKDISLKQFWGQGGVNTPFKNEVFSDDKMVTGVVAMSGSSLGTYGSQFFILTHDTPWMKGHHTIIGHVTKGLDIVAKIEQTPTNTSGEPQKDIILKTISISD